MWNILHLQAIDENGKALWPERFPLERLQAIRRQDIPIFNCMYQGDPTALTSQLFKQHWFNYAHLALAPRVNDNDQVLIPQEMVPWLFFDDNSADPIMLERCLIYQGYDLAISEKETADYTCCCTLALDPRPGRLALIVLDVARDHLSFQKTQAMMTRLAIRWQPNGIGIENVAYQAAAVQQAKQHLLFSVSEVRADRDKVTRARLPSSLAEDGKLYIVRGPWTDDFLDELVSFPGGKHDDQVDALSIATYLARQYVPSGFLLW